MNLHLLSIDDKKANLIASHLGRAYGICDIIKKSPFYIANARTMMPLDIMARHDVVTDRIYSRTGGESIVKEEYYDVVLEVASYARKHLQIARAIHEKSKQEGETKVHEHCHRAFLIA